MKGTDEGQLQKEMEQLSVKDKAKVPERPEETKEEKKAEKAEEKKDEKWEWKKKARTKQKKNNESLLSLSPLFFYCLYRELIYLEWMASRLFFGTRMLDKEEILELNIKKNSWFQKISFFFFFFSARFKKDK